MRLKRYMDGYLGDFHDMIKKGRDGSGCWRMGTLVKHSFSVLKVFDTESSHLRVLDL